MRSLIVTLLSPGSNPMAPMEAMILVSLFTPAPIASQECGEDCVGVIKAATQWLLERRRGFPMSDSTKMYLDTRVRLGGDRRSASLGDTTYAGEVRSAASSLGIVAADPRARPLWEQCQTAPGQECAGERGRTQLLVKMIRFHGPTEAEAQVSLDVVGSGPGPLQSGGSLWGQLFLGKEDGEWMVTGTGVMIVS